MRDKNLLIRNAQKGNALVETVVLSVVMVPLLAMLPLLGKISDINNATVQSSRYVAWERTVLDEQAKSHDDIMTEVNNRFFVKPDLQIKSGQGFLSDSQYQNPFWSGYGTEEDGSGNRMIKSGASLTVDELNKKPRSIVGDLSGGISVLGNAMSKVTGGEWNLEDKGLFTAMVSLEVGGNKMLPGTKNCNNEESNKTFACVRRSNTILVDGWEVKDAAHAEARTKTLVPAAGLEDLGDTAVDLVSLIPFFKDIGALESDDNGGFGYVASEVVPLERYVEP